MADQDSKANDSGDDRRRGGGGSRDGGKGRYRKRACRFCGNKELEINYKRIDITVRSVSNKGKILPRRLTGNCAKHQRMISRAIKQARMAGFMPFTVR